MFASPEMTLNRTNPAPVNETPVVSHIPQWEQIPAEKRQELTQILAGMLVRQVQTQGVSHEHPS